MNADLRAAELLWDAWQTGTRLSALPEDVRPRDDFAAMAVQDRLAELAGPAYGWKLGATTETARAFLGIDSPFAGRLFERFRHEEGELVPADTLSMGVAEPEFAFRLATDLDPAAGHTLDEVLDAVDTMLLALEMPDSRYADHVRAGKAQVLADAACSARFVAGREIPDWRDLDLAAHPVIAYLDGAEFARGTGAAVLGDPRFALHWLAGELPRLGQRLRAGDIVMTGTATTPVPITYGSHVLADFGDLGTVEARFAE